MSRQLIYFLAQRGLQRQENKLQTFLIANIKYLFKKEKKMYEVY